MNWEAEFLLFLQEHIRCGFLTVIMKAFTYMGNYGILWYVLCLTLTINKKTRKLGIMCWITLVLNFLICNVLIKGNVGRTRPFEVIDGLTYLIAKPVDTSFPSGHTSSAFSLASLITCYLPRNKKWIGVISLTIAAMIGFSRMYLGVHYPSDVIVGFLLGIIFGLSTYFLLNKKLNELINEKTSGS